MSQGAPVSPKGVIVQICVGLLNAMFSPETVYGLDIFDNICLFRTGGSQFVGFVF